MARAVWTGAVSFGLVHIPVELYPAESRDELKFSMLDRRDLSPVGYNRINKKTGKDVPWAEIVKGHEYDDDRYVVLTDEDFRLANIAATQTVDIFGFAEACTIPDQYFETPYVLVPGKRGDKGYALLREALTRTDRVGLARVVIRAREHVCALVAVEQQLLVITLRYASELAAMTQHAVDSHAPAAAFSAKELQMAERLVRDMEASFDPSSYTDRYRADVMKRIEQKIAAGETALLTAPDSDAPVTTGKRSNVVDLMTLLQQSLKGAKSAAVSSDEPKRATVTELKVRTAAKKAHVKTASRKSPVRTPRRRVSRA